MILRRNFHAARFEVFHRLIRAAVTELQLERFPAERESENLVTETDAENGDATSNQVTHRLDRVIKSSGITLPVRKENPCGLVFQRFIRGSRGGHHAHFEAVLAQSAEDVVLHSEVVGDNWNVRRRKGVPRVARIGCFWPMDQLEIRALLILLVPSEGTW